MFRYHIYCVGLRKVPEGRWHCQECAMCSSCGVSDPGPGDSKWFYEVILNFLFVFENNCDPLLLFSIYSMIVLLLFQFKKIEKTGSKVYRRTLCAPCSRYIII